AIKGRTIAEVRVFESRLRTKVPRGLAGAMSGARITAVRRRAKYLLIDTTGPTLVSHLGMTGAWRLESNGWDKQKHDHIALRVGDGASAVFCDPRRFGLLDFADAQPFDTLGPEPLSPDFSGATLRAALARRKAPVKTANMDQRVVVGVGNIYAAEA